MPDPATPQDRAAWRSALRKAAYELPPNFGPVPDRIEITATFECVCGGGCPAECYRCIACSPGEPAAIPDHVIEATADLIGEARGEEGD